MSTAGVLLFVHDACGEEARARILQHLNKKNQRQQRVTEEVLQLYWVRPTREHILGLCKQLQGDEWLKEEVELLAKLRPNNGLRDLTAPWRLSGQVTQNYHLLVGLETVNPEYRRKYPLPNLTLQAGSTEKSESVLECALREMKEESRITVSRECLSPRPIKLLRGGMWMYPCYVNEMRHVAFSKEGVSISPEKS